MKISIWEQGRWLSLVHFGCYHKGINNNKREGEQFPPECMEKQEMLFSPVSICNATSVQFVFSSIRFRNFIRRYFHFSQNFPQPKERIDCNAGNFEASFVLMPHPSPSPSLKKKSILASFLNHLISKSQLFLKPFFPLTVIVFIPNLQETKFSRFFPKINLIAQDGSKMQGFKIFKLLL